MTVKHLKEYLWKGGSPLNYNWPEHPKSQDLPDDIYYLTFGVPIVDREVLLKHGYLVGNKPLMYPLDGIEAVDIDTEEDFLCAEKMLREGKVKLDFVD